METIVKTISMFVNDKLDQILTAHKLIDELGSFIFEYLHEHPDEIDVLYAVINFCNSGERKNIFYKKWRKVFNDKEQIFEAIVRTRLQSGEYEILYRNTTLRPEEQLNKNILVYIMDKWNDIKQIKKFFDEHPDSPFNIEISSLDNKKFKVICNQKILKLMELDKSIKNFYFV